MVNRKSDEISQKYFASKESAGYSGEMKGKISVRRLLIRWLESFDGRHMDTRPFLELSISFDSIRGDPQAVFNHLDKPDLSGFLAIPPINDKISQKSWDELSHFS